jgi:hypothetical protein
MEYPPRFVRQPQSSGNHPLQSSGVVYFFLGSRTVAKMFLRSPLPIHEPRDLVGMSKNLESLHGFL